MNKLKPLVTISTLVHYTHPDFVISAIDSIYNQTYKNIEHIIVNDAPDDKQYWPQIKKYLIDNNLPSRIIEHEVNFGLCKTLNQVLEISNGKYFCGCSDDIFFTDKIEKQVKILEGLGDNYAVLYSDTELINNNGESLGLNYITDVCNEENRPEGDIFHILIDRVIIPPISVLYNLKCLLEIGGFDESLGFEDLDIFLRLSKKYKIKYFDEISSLYRQHGDSLSRNFDYWTTDLIKIYEKHSDNDRIRLNLILFKEYSNSSNKFGENKIYNFKFFYKLRSLILRNFKVFLNKKKLFDLDGLKVCVFNGERNWYDSQKIVRDLGNGWYVPNIKEIEEIGINLNSNQKVWSITEGYGLYAWYYNELSKRPNYCLRDKLLTTIAFKK